MISGPEADLFTHVAHNARRRLMDRLVHAAALGGVLLTMGIMLTIFAVLLHGAWMALRQIGWHFFTTQAWNPVPGRDKYGVLSFLYGTSITTCIALLLGVPTGIGTAIFITRIAPRWLAGPVSFLVELLAAIPSIAYGLWGCFVMSPWLQNYFEPVIYSALHHINLLPVGKYPDGRTEFFLSNLVHGGPSGSDFLAGGLILAIMILPIITAITRDVLNQFPADLEQGARSLGATWWQTTQLALAYCRVGIFGAVMLGMGRAIGETMAVIMVIGNTDRVSASLFAGGQTMAGLLANEFMEADHPIYLSAVFYVALVLMLSSLLTNLAARFMLARIQKPNKMA
ncbi:MAG: phosphate ABC transporter permease subunit PstC [Phycisphaerae bacterium]